jgi:succinyl-CoA:(S)-malate CoA-transferase subunit B
LYGALGVLLCIQALAKTGRGQVVDIGLYEPIFRILDELAPSYHMKGYVRERMGPGTVNVVPHSHYPTKDKKWVAIACTNDKIFERLALAMGVPEWGGSGKWGTITQREAERSQVDEYVGVWTAQRTREEVLSTCESFQIPCGSVYAIDEIFEDPQYAARENIKYMKDSHGDTHAIPNLVPRLSDTPGKIRSLGPSLGQHNDEIFSSRLGLSKERIAELKAKGVI